MSKNTKALSDKNKKLVFVAMSGGVDSSVAALLLKKQYDVVGVFMRCYNLDGCQDKDAEDARRVAERLQIPFYVWDFEREYKERVVEYMVEGYKRGITPNPDVMCNREIKFGLFLERALSLGADFVATGHYVRLGCSLKIENCKLKIAKDLNKDQSYFLWTLTQDKLKYCLFPIGDYLKSEVRAMAKKAGLPTAEKKDSQGICFLGKVTFADFLKEYIPQKRGALLTAAGEKLGEHFGSEFYTIGQRHINADFKFPKTGASIRQPFYVAAKNIKTNTVVLAEGDGNPALYKKEIELAGVNFLNDDYYSLIRANRRIDILARVRYRQPLAKATLASSHQSSVISYKLTFDEPVKFVAPGQSAVFYSKKGETLGGGIIL